MATRWVISSKGIAHAVINGSRGGGNAFCCSVQRAERGIPVAMSCRALEVSQAWFFKWRNRDRSPRRKRRAALAATLA
jgi:hypothetical protein